MSIPIFIINLASSIDRKKYMQVLCIEHGLYPIFIEAVNGHELSAEAINQVCDQDKACKIIGRLLLSGEIGCALSHKKVYQKMIDENIEIGLILEDDTRLEPSLNKVLSSIDLFPKNWELVLLGHHAGYDKYDEIASPISFWGNHRITEEILLGRLVGYGYGTYGYLVNQQGAKKLLKKLNTIYKPIDHYTSDDKVINVYAMSPTVVKVQQQFNTLIDENSVREEFRLSFIKRLLSKIKILRFLQLMNQLRKHFQFIKVYKK